jgi:hypothetical protein
MIYQPHGGCRHSGALCIWALLSVLAPSIALGQIADLRIPLRGDNASPVFEPELKEYLIAHNGRYPWVYPRSLSRGVVGSFVRQTLGGGELVSYTYRILQIVDDQSAIIRCTAEDSDEPDVFFLLKNYDFRNQVDDKVIGMLGVYRVSGTYRYMTVSGASRTIYAVEPFDVVRISAEVRAELEKDGEKVDDSATLRKWTIKDVGAFEGVFAEENEGTVVLRDRSGVMFRFRLGDLSKNDQEWIAAHEKELADRAKSVRSWTMRDGKSLEADFLRQERDIVVLRSALGEQISVSWRNLSEKDQNWIRLTRKGR